MKRRWIWTAVVLGCLTALILTVATCSGAFSARDMADAMASGYEDWFDVDGGEQVDEEPPAEDSDAQPALLSFNAPLSVGPNEMTPFDSPFQITLNYDVASEADIAFVLLHVTQANKDDQAPSYIRVQFADLLPQGGSVQINAQINNIANLPGNAFQIRLGLQGDNGLVGNWVNWNVITVPADGEFTRVPQCQAIPYSYPGSLYVNEETGALEYYPPTQSNVVFMGSCPVLEEFQEFMVWDDSYRGPNLNFPTGMALFPSGTRWTFYNSATMMPVPACWLELHCASSSYSSVPFNFSDFTHSH